MTIIEKLPFSDLYGGRVIITIFKQNNRCRKYCKLWIKKPLVKSTGDFVLSASNGRVGTFQLNKQRSSGYGEVQAGKKCRVKQDNKNVSHNVSCITIRDTKTIG